MTGDNPGFELEGRCSIHLSTGDQMVAKVNIYFIPQDSKWRTSPLIVLLEGRGKDQDTNLRLVIFHNFVLSNRVDTGGVIKDRHLRPNRFAPKMEFFSQFPGF